MRGAGRSARAYSWSTPHPPSLRSGTFSHRGRRGSRFTAAANHHRSRLTEALISRLSFSPLWEKVAEPERSAGEVG